MQLFISGVLGDSTTGTLLLVHGSVALRGTMHLGRFPTQLRSLKRSVSCSSQEDRELIKRLPSKAPLEVAEGSPRRSSDLAASSRRCHTSRTCLYRCSSPGGHQASVPDSPPPVRPLTSKAGSWKVRVPQPREARGPAFCAAA